MLTINSLGQTTESRLTFSIFSLYINKLYETYLLWTSNLY